MKTKKYILILVIIFVIGVIIGLIGGILYNSNNTSKEQKEESTKEIKKEELDSSTEESLEQAMGILARLVFHVEKEYLTIEDLTDLEKVNIAVSLSNKDADESTGEELNTIFKNNFGNNQTLNFVDIKCPYDHGSEEANTMYKYDSTQNKYVKGKHGGHGGSISNEIAKELSSINVISENNQYHYQAKVLYYELEKCPDVGPCTYGSAYKTYKDAINKTNELVKIKDNEKYTSYLQDNFPVVHIDKIMEDYKKQLLTVDFVFEEQDNNIIFKYYKII